MAIVVNCPTCGVKLTLEEDRAGSFMQCPKCDGRITVPAPAAPNPAPPPQPTPTIVYRSQRVAAPAPPPPMPVSIRAHEEVFLDWKEVKVTSHRLILSGEVGGPMVYAMKHITHVECFRLPSQLFQVGSILTFWGIVTLCFGIGIILLAVGIPLMCVGGYNSVLRVHTSGGRSRLMGGDSMVSRHLIGYKPQELEKVVRAINKAMLFGTP